MRFNASLTPLPFLLYAAVGAVNLTLLEAEVPLCAVGCFARALPSTPADLEDLHSVCTNTALQLHLVECVKWSSCNYTEDMAVANAHLQLCAGQPFESRTETARAFSVALGIPAVVAIALRCYSRYSLTLKLGFDDYTILAAGAFVFGLMAIAITNCNHGFGLHIWNVDPEHVVSLQKAFYASEILYQLSLMLTKVSILLFYLRVFPSQKFRITTLAIMLSVMISGTVVILIAIFQCWPISGAWNPANKSRCIDVNALAYGASGVNIAQDIIIMVLPIPQLLKLEMTRKKRFHLLFMFGLGGFACITSIVRLRYLVAFGSNIDTPWNNVIPASWSMAEIAVGIICTCLPAIRALFTSWLPKVFHIKHSIQDRSGRTDSRSFHLQDGDGSIALEHLEASEAPSAYHKARIVKFCKHHLKLPMTTSKKSLLKKLEAE